MKELSTEEKAKLYDKIIEFAYNKHRFSSNLSEIKLIEEMFPKIKESKNERIRKELLQFVDINTLSINERHDRWIAWLEKQGKHDMGISEATKQELTDNLNKALENETPESWNEFLDEQKSVNKVKPKFHLGDWVVFNNNHQSIYQVEKIEDGYYILRHTHGGTFRVCILHGESLRLWDITKDVKACDILAADPIKGIEGCSFSSSFIAIYKERNGEDFDSYCFVGFNGKFDKSGIEHSTDRVHPATKEQRDFLFQKMEEAGYEWDAGERKLEEIKYNKAKWKNHDEEMIKGIRNFIGLNQDLVEGGVDEWIDWLKEVEDRVQPQLKQEWKPSDEQLEALKKAINIKPFENPSDSFLWGLYEQLKKLREE